MQSVIISICLMCCSVHCSVECKMIVVVRRDLETITELEDAAGKQGVMKLLLAKSL